MIQRSLPRPLSLPKYRAPSLDSNASNPQAQAEELIRAEVEAILIHDAELFPINANAAPVSFAEWDSFSDEELRAVRFPFRFLSFIPQHVFILSFFIILGKGSVGAGAIERRGRQSGGP